MFELLSESEQTLKLESEEKPPNCTLLTLYNYVCLVVMVG